MQLHFKGKSGLTEEIQIQTVALYESFPYRIMRLQ